MPDLPELIERNDSDELLREIDRRSSRSDWEGLLELRNRCHAAVERGKQLWGVAAHAEYRLALEAPGECAASVIDSAPGRFAIGPLPEVAASTHTWSELQPALVEGPTKGVTAYERVVRGEDLTSDTDLGHHVAMFELPLKLQPWEPEYPVATYRSDAGVFEAPYPDLLDSRPPDEGTGSVLDEREAIEALLGLTRTWVDESNGKAIAIAVEGPLSSALEMLEIPPPAAVRISSRSALAWMAWAGASGGAHGRRAGMAAGRSKAWWALAGVAGVLDSWPCDFDDLGARSEELEWWTWQLDSSRTGWSLRLAAVDPVDGVVFAVESSDTAD